MKASIDLKHTCVELDVPYTSPLPTHATQAKITPGSCVPPLQDTSSVIILSHKFQACWHLACRFAERRDNLHGSLMGGSERLRTLS